MLASHDVFNFYKSQPAQMSKNLQILKFEQDFSLRVRSGNEYKYKYFPSKKKIELASEKKNLSYVFTIGGVNYQRVRYGEVSPKEAFKWNFSQKKRSSTKNRKQKKYPVFKTLQDFKKFVFRHKGRKSDSSSFKNFESIDQTNANDYEVELSKNQRYIDSECVFFNHNSDKVTLRKTLADLNYSVSRAKIRIKRLKNIFYLIEKKYNVEAFLFSFLKKY